MNPRKMFADSVRIDRWSRLSRSFEAIGGYRPWRLSLTGHGAPQRLDAMIVAGDLFRVLRIRPALGREFSSQEIRNAAGVAIISHALWQQHFGGDPTILGRTITLDGNPYTVVGVMPAGFAPVLPRMSRYFDVWTTSAVDYEPRLNGMNAGFTVCQAIGRLRPGVTLPQAQAEMDAISIGLEREGRHFRGTGVNLAWAASEVGENLRPALWALFAAVGCVLLIACTNLTGLALARESARQRETAIRAVLGASRGRLMGETLAESLVLAIAGTLLGLAASHWLLRALKLVSPVRLGDLGDLRMDGVVILFAGGLAAITTLLFGLLPAMAASRSDLNSALKESAGASRAGVLSTRAVLTASEVALAAALLLAAGLLLRSFLALRGVDTGFEPHHLITAELPLHGNSYGTPARVQALADALNRRLLEVPGVESAGFTNSIALAGTFMMTGHFAIDGAPVTDRSPEANLVAASPAYFHAAGMRLLAGRSFSDAEALTGAAVVINEAAARQFFGSPARAVGHPISGDICKSCRIVGVVANLRNFGLKNEAAPELYGPLASLPCPSLDIAVRTYATPAQLVAGVRAAVFAAAPDLALERISTMRDVLGEDTAQPRFDALLVGLFAMMALLLAAVGVFGVTASWVAQRTREIGVRMALGARSRTVLAMVLRQSLVAGGTGIAAGVALGLMTTRLLRSLLFGVAPGDPATFLVVVSAMLAVIVAAAWIPALRAARVDPMDALRHE